MTPPEETHPELPPWLLGPGPQARSLIALILRLGLGLPLLASGISGFYGAQAGRLGPGNGMPDLSMYAGAQLSLQALPYLEIVTALAVLLGFLTTLAAALAALEAILPWAMQAAMLVSMGGVPVRGYGYGPDALIVQWIFNATLILNLTLAAGVIWFAASGCNRWSLDGAMWSRRRKPKRPARPRISHEQAVELIPVLPASGGLVKPFDASDMDELSAGPASSPEST